MGSASIWRNNGDSGHRDTQRKVCGHVGCSPLLRWGHPRNCADDWRLLVHSSRWESTFVHLPLTVGAWQTFLLALSVLMEMANLLFVLHYFGVLLRSIAQREHRKLQVQTIFHKAMASLERCCCIWEGPVGVHILGCVHPLPCLNFLAVDWVVDQSIKALKTKLKASPC